MKLDSPISIIMTAGPETVGPQTPLSTVRDILFRMHAHHVPVVLDRRLIGIVSSNDLLRVGPAGSFPPVGRVDAAFERIQVRDVMTPDPICIGVEDSIRRAMEVLRTVSFGALPVIYDDELVGIVTVADVLGWVLEHAS